MAASRSDGPALACMLTVVHAPDFANLAQRINRTVAFSMGAQAPTTHVIFDNNAAIEQYCSAHACRRDELVPWSFERLVGPAAYSKARSVLGSHPPTGRRAAGCTPRTPGRVTVPVAQEILWGPPGQHELQRVLGV